MKNLKFSDGDQMPAIALGTSGIEAGRAYQVIRTAIELGYRHFDCAPAYGNEKEIGKALADAIQQGDVVRGDLWITTKLSNDSHLEEAVMPCLEKSLKNLQLDYVDLYLVHWPVALRAGVIAPEASEDYLTKEEAPLIDTWTGMEECIDEELTKHIGVSNFNIETLNMLNSEGTLEPELNQIELHPYLPQQSLYDYCRTHDILVAAYAPLGSPGKRDDRRANEPLLLHEPIIVALAEKHGCTPAQILIAWSLGRKTAVIIKSSDRERLKENLSALNVKLDREDLRRLIILPKYRFFDGKMYTRGGSPYKLSDIWEY